MKLSENTLSIFKNFAAINSGVVLQKGKVQKSISPEKSILVEAELDDDFPEQFGIYDLNQFLGNITTLDNPELTFSKENVLLDNGTIDFTYGGCSPNLIITPPDKELVMKDIDVTFSLSNSALQALTRLAAMNNLPTISVVGKNNQIRLQIHEKSNDTSNQGSLKIADYDGKDFSVSFKVENLKLIPNEYDVEIVIGKFAKFTAKNGKLKYWIAAETK